MSDLRTGLVEAVARMLIDDPHCDDATNQKVWDELAFTVKDGTYEKAEAIVDRTLGFLTDNAEFQNLVWPRDKELPKNPEEWPLVPKLELLAAWGDGMDDRDGKYDETERTVQNDVRRAARIIEAIAALSDSRDTGEKP